MVDWPSNAAPVPAFVAPGGGTADALADAARMLDDLFKPHPPGDPTKPRKLARRPSRFPRGFLLSPLVDCGLGFLLPPVGLSTPCLGSPELAGASESFVVPPGWSLSSHCAGYNLRHITMQRLGSCGPSAWFADNGTRGPFAANGVWNVSWFQKHSVGASYHLSYRYYDGSSSLPKPTVWPDWQWDYKWRSSASPKPALVARGNGVVSRRPPGLTTARRPPKPQEKHVKRGWGAGAFPGRAILEGALEGCEMVAEVHRTLPRGLQDTSGTCAGQMGALWDHPESVDWGEALENLIDNEIEDHFFGIAGELTKKEAQALGRPRGMNVRPATGHGGWSPCLFCNP